MTNYDDAENGNVPQFRLKTLFAVVTCLAVLCAGAMRLNRPGPKSLAERWHESSAKTEEALITEFGPPEPVRKALVDQLKLNWMPANARWLQWNDLNEPRRLFIAVIVDGKARMKLDVHDHGHE